MFTWPADSPITKRIDKCIMDLILVEMLPFNAVQGAAFQRLNFNDPLIKSRYKVKSEKFFRDLMHVTYDNVKKKIMDKVSKAKWISFTTDIWTSTGKTCSLLSFTAHFISEGKKEKVILGAADMSKNHKASYIFEKLSEIIKDFELEGRIHVGVSDNAGNMVAAMKLGDIKHFGCVSHTLQLAIHDAFNKNVQLKSLIEKCGKIVSHFKKSEKASRTFKSIQKECGLPDHRHLQDVSVRWNSSYTMMERLVEQSAAVNLYAAKYDGISVISAECSDDSCASLIIPLIQLIKGKIEGKICYISTNNCLIIATLLDPRFKNKYLNKDQTKLAVNELKDSFDFEVYDNIEFVPVKTPSTNTTKSSKSSIWEKHDTMPNKVEKKQKKHY
ncbi:zinc finger BED domain-containing protein 4-like [Haematobia irritans]|uniref:zinc finger BED domain-containing protein 4-like n=1 Tax=Haematobia irritans TaxID=7368 RepID=UPI003F4FF609